MQDPTKVQETPKEEKKEIAGSLAPLPSMGKVYSHPALKDRTALPIRGMKVKELGYLQSEALLRQGNVIDKVIGSCLIDKDVPTNELIMADREMLMLTARILTVGKHFTVEGVKCPECGKVATSYKYDLSKVEYTTLKDVSPSEANTNSFNFTLLSGKNIVFKFITTGDERDIDAIISRLTKEKMEVNELEERIKRQWLQFENTKDKNQIAKIIQELEGADIVAFNEYVEKMEPKISRTLPFICPNCKVETMMSVPLILSFFRLN